MIVMMNDQKEEVGNSRGNGESHRTRTESYCTPLMLPPRIDVLTFWRN